MLLSALITCRLVFMAFLLNATPGGSSIGSTAHWLLSILSLASSITDNNIFLSYAFSNLNVNTFPPSPKIISLYALTILSRSHGETKQNNMIWAYLLLLKIVAPRMTSKPLHDVTSKAMAW